MPQEARAFRKSPREHQVLGLRRLSLITRFNWRKSVAQNCKAQIQAAKCNNMEAIQIGLSLF